MHRYGNRKQTQFKNLAVGDVFYFPGMETWRCVKLGARQYRSVRGDRTFSVAESEKVYRG